MSAREGRQHGRSSKGPLILEVLVPDVLSPDLLAKMDAYWRAANYLSVGQLYSAVDTG